MNKLNQITDVKELLGKTIEAFVSDNVCDELYLKFTDNSFVVFTANEYSDGFQYPNYKVEISDFEVEQSDKNLLELGIITKKEYDIAIKEELLAQTIRYEQYALEQIRNRELEELKELKRLKEKYNGQILYKLR